MLWHRPKLTPGGLLLQDPPGKPPKGSLLKQGAINPKTALKMRFRAKGFFLVGIFFLCPKLLQSARKDTTKRGPICGKLDRAKCRPGASQGKTSFGGGSGIKAHTKMAFGRPAVAPLLLQSTSRGINSPSTCITVTSLGSNPTLFLMQELYG